jgi:1-acyl-sn-glycerol-3-phosphate acyltransferase
MAVADFPIGFIAKATLFNLPIFGTILRWAGAIPIHRAQDAPAAASGAASRAASNKGAFSAISNRLRQNGHVAIFPEGISHMEAHVMPLYTGITRMALDAVQGIVGAYIFFGSDRTFCSNCLIAGDDGVDIWVVAVGLNYTADGGRRFRSLATIEWSANPLVITKSTRDSLAAHETEATLPENALDEIFSTNVAEALKTPDPNRPPPRPIDPVIIELTKAIQLRMIAVTVNTPTREDLWLAVIARKIFLPSSVRFNFKEDDHDHNVATHLSSASLCERVFGCSLHWAHHKAPLKFQATRAIIRAYFSIVNSVTQDQAPEKDSPQEIALQLRSDIKAYSDNLRNLGLSDHFIALDVDGFVFLLLAISRLLWLCLTGQPFVTLVAKC